MRTRIALAAATAATLISSTVIVTVDAVGAMRTTSTASGQHDSRRVAAGVVSPTTRDNRHVAGASIFTVVQAVAGTVATGPGPITFISTVMQRESTPPPPPPPPPDTDATSTTTPTWACIRYYESTDRYNTPSAPDGAYSIIESTWQGMGYSGLAYESPPSVQNAAALKLYNARGWEPWSTRTLCGL